MLLFAALNAACDAAVVRRLEAAGFPDVRPAHGYVFQHLLVEPHRITDLARKLGMTAQGASKLVIEMEGHGYVARRGDPADARNRVVTLADRGRAVIAAGRTARAAVIAELLAGLPPADAETLLASLGRLAEQTGGLRELLARRLRPGG